MRHLRGYQTLEFSFELHVGKRPFKATTGMVHACCMLATIDRPERHPGRFDVERGIRPDDNFAAQSANLRILHTRIGEGGQARLAEKQGYGGRVLCA